jgi:hypothetical protein
MLRVLCVLAVVGTSVASFGQQYFSNGAVRRVVKYRILPGKTADFYKWLSWAPKVLDAEKQAGLVQSYSIMHSTEFVGPDKYDVVLVIEYKDMATLDTLPDKTEPIVARVYGSPEARAANGKLGSESMEVVSAELVREIRLK